MRHCQMHYESRQQDASSSDPPTTGSTVTRRLPRKIACQLKGGAPGEGTRPALGGPSTRRGEGTAITLSPRRPRSLPRCASARAAARHPRPTRKRSGIPAATHCAIARKRRRAGAATPTRRNITQALDRAKRAIDVMDISNEAGKDHPRRKPTPRPPTVALVRDREGGRPAGGPARDVVGLAVGWRGAGWLTSCGAGATEGSR